MTRQRTSLDRRSFLRTSLGTLAAAGLPSLLRADKPKDEFGGFIFGVQSYSFRNFDLEPALKRIQELGLKYVEFYQKHVPLEAKPEQIEAILRLGKEYGITPVCWGVQGFTKDKDKT